MKQEIKQLSQIEHVLHRPSMYVGSVVSEKKEEFTFEDSDYFKLSEREYVPALIKIFNEIIDNSIDEYVRTNGEFANKISIKMTHNIFECTDNGRGIPNIKMKTLNGEEKYQAEVAFTEMLSGANYDNDDEATIGTNGLGSKAAAIFSKKTIIRNDDSHSAIIIETKNNLSEVKVNESSSKSSGVYTKMWPDLKYFGLDHIDNIHQDVIRERLLHLSVSYPGITFKFNAKTIRLNDKKYFDMFNIKEFIKINDNISIGISHSPSDQFEHFSLVNGLVTKGGGTHINIISNDIVNPIREKLKRKFKTIKPGDIKQKIRLVVVFKNFKNARYTSQTKEEITNSEREIRSYLGEDYKIGLDKFIKKILKNDDIILPISELFLLKEQAQHNAELKKLSKVKKRIKSEKYTPSVGGNDLLVICEGQSAKNGLLPGLGRRGIAYYELKGKPMNVYEISQSKFTSNKELTDLYQIVQNGGFKEIAVASDADLDGIAINGLLLAFFNKYLPDFLKDGRVYRLQTPVMALLDKKKKPYEWIYDLKGHLEEKRGYTFKYFKGLGGYTPEQLKEIIRVDGIDKMLLKIEFDKEAEKSLDDWYNSKNADIRKIKIMNNDFDLIKL